MIYPVLGVAIGVVIGSLLPTVYIPIGYSKLMGIALLACLDTVFGGIRAALGHKFDNSMFLMGFFSNAIMAALFVFLGSKFGIDLYLVALFTFGLRIFQNANEIRRMLWQHQK